jgi:pyruvate formate lyase activating enzyme
MQGLITNIQRFSVHDGPGIRTTVFLKGCNLRCFWCHNPEDMNPYPEIQFFDERCILCNACVETCPHGAHVINGNGHTYNRDLCETCGECVETCYAKGLIQVGEWMDVEQVIGEVMADEPFYKTSGGGVTLSGGEPLLQIDFVRAVFEICRHEGVHTAIETAANLPWARFESVLPLLDLVMMDIKMMDSDKHQRSTGVPNQRILANAAKLGHGPTPLIVRTPIIPGLNDTAEDIAAIAGFVADFPSLEYYELLPYHPMATSKYRSLDQEYDAADLKPPTKALMAELAEIASQTGIPVRTG